MATSHKTPAAISETKRGNVVQSLRAHAPKHDIEQRKKDHINIILSGAAQHARANGFDQFEFEHCALPDVDLDAIDLSGVFLGKKLKLPYLASSMTGGPEQGGRINLAIAEAAQHLGFAMGVGSQRIALGGGKTIGLDKSIRRAAPDILLFANLGAVQLTHGMGIDDAVRAVDLIEADALILHLNPLQEALQPGGDRNWTGVGAAIEKVCRALHVPVIIKEAGAGISVSTAQKLVGMGVAAIDVAGVGGSSWAAVEGHRSDDTSKQAMAEIYRNWGIPTATALATIHAAFPSLPLIASGGIRHGLDGAKAVRLGATLVGQAAALLEAATQGPDQVAAKVTQWADTFRIACFCTDSQNLDCLRHAPLQDGQQLREHAKASLQERAVDNPFGDYRRKET
jgi:isopentenyl-diphosphate Delta-isomerase